MKQRRTNSGSSPVFRYIRQMENMVSKMTSENPIERIQSLERRIGEVDKIPNIENFVRQIKERMWITKEVLTISEASAYLGLSESYIYKLTASKQIPPLQAQRQTRLFQQERVVRLGFEKSSETPSGNGN